MKIRDVRPIIINMPFVRVGLPHSTATPRMQLIVQVTTDEGITGVGQSHATGFSGTTLARAIETMIKPKAVGKDPMSIAALWNDMFISFYSTGSSGIIMAAISGFEMALWDIKGKALNTPVYQLLGGQAHDKLRAYASLADYSTPKEAGEASEILVEQGFTAFKLHQCDVESVAAARKAAGDKIDIMLDLASGCRWDPVTAVRMGRKFENYNIYWYEQPIFPRDDYDGLAYVKSHLNVPLAAGEDEYTARGFNRLLGQRLVDYLQPSVIKIGGILEVKRVFAAAAALNRPVAPHCWASGPAMAATLHVAFSEPDAFIIETPVDLPEAPILTQSTAPEKGFWKLPVGPGLGIEFDEKSLNKYIIK